MKNVISSAVLFLLFIGCSYTPNKQDYRDLLTGDSTTSAAAAERLARVPVDSLLSAIGSFNSYPSDVQKGEPFECKNPLTNGEEAPYWVYIPVSYDPAKPTPLLFWLHGGVNRPSFSGVDPQELKNLPAMQQCARNGWIGVYPLGRRTCSWWNPEGVGNIERILRAVKRMVNVDDNRVVMSGFSDGGSAGYYWAAATPSDFSLFVCYSGDPGIAAVVNENHAHPRNILSRPIIAANGGWDRLYPASRIIGLIDGAKQFGADIRFTLYDTSGHNYGYLPSEWDSLKKAVTTNVRNPFPSHIYWEADNPDYGTLDWLTIERFNFTAAEQPLNRKFRVNIADSLVDFGALVKNGGGSAQVLAISENQQYVANLAHLLPGDKITAINGGKVGSAADFATALKSLHRGDSCAVAVNRGGKRMTLACQIPQAMETDYYSRRTGSTAGVDATFNRTANQFSVIVSRVERFYIAISPQMVDISRPVRVTVNGTVHFDAKVTPDKRWMLQQIALSRDRKAVWIGKIEVDLSD